MPDDRIANARPSDAYVRKIDPAWVDPIGEACLRFDIDTPERVVPFLANCAHESQSFTRLVESMHYSATRLLTVFPKYFTPEEAIEFAYDDVRIGERVYGGRMGNGSEGMGDGYLYRGRGLMHVTGRGMYAKCGRALGADLEEMPALLERPSFAALSAAWVWAEEKRCNELADAAKFQSIVLRINGGLNGMADRLAWLDKLRA